MPSWDFKCSRCGVEREITFSSFEAMEQLSPFGCDRTNCNGRMERRPAAPNFVLKGDGWTPKHFGEK